MRPRILVLERSTDLVEQVTAAATDIEPTPEVVACNRIGSVGEVMATQGPFTVLVAGPSLACRSGLRRLALLHEEMPATAILLTFTDRPDASLREIIQAGADDLVRLPLDDGELALALERAIRIGGRRQAPDSRSPTSSSSTALPVPVRNGLARVFTVSSATGGCGKTFYATNMAMYLARHTGQKVVLVDLDLQFGEVSTALRLRPNYTIYDALRRDEDGGQMDFGDHLEEFLVRHETGFYVLAAPKDPAEADRITPSDVTRILEVLRQNADYVIVDTPAALTEVVLAAFDLSEHLVTLATVDLPSVRNMGVFLQTLERLRIPAENISLLLNKAENDVGLDVSQIVKLFPQGFRSILPYAKEVSRSINMGMPVLGSDPTSEVARKLAAGLADFLPEADRARADKAEVARPTSRFVRFFGRQQATLATTGSVS